MTYCIKIGQEVAWHGESATITDIDGYGVIIEVCGEEVFTDLEELAEQNPDIVECDENE